MYKDLESLNIYDFELINQIHQDIILIIAGINELGKENKLKIEEHQKIMELGMNIDNYVINQTYLNNSLLNSNQLHKSYLEVYHKYHTEWLTKLHQNIELFYNQIKQHSSVNENSIIKINKTIAKTLMNDIIENVVENINTTSTPTFTTS